MSCVFAMFVCSCGITRNLELHCWGNLGIPQAEFQQEIKRLVPSKKILQVFSHPCAKITLYFQVSAGGEPAETAGVRGLGSSHTCVIGAQYEIVCLGEDTRGQAPGDASGAATSPPFFASPATVVIPGNV